MIRALVRLPAVPWPALVVVAALVMASAAYGQEVNIVSTAGAGTRTPPSTSLDPAKVALGRRLFFDTRLSGDGWLSCASCHDPAHGYSEARAVSVGVFGQRGKRHAPTLIGRASGQSEFWDGRAVTLEDQVLQPILNPDEMGMTLETLEKVLAQDPAYRGLTRESLVEALAGYVRTIRSENSNFDLYVDHWPGALTDRELDGMRLFHGKARCNLCHSGPQLTDESFHNTGVAWRGGVLQDDGRAAITGMPCQKGAFKTPTLRDVGRRGPYMHDGSLPTLEEVIEFYDRGGNQNPGLDEKIVPLNLSAAEKSSLLAFLRTALNGTIKEGSVPKSMQTANH